MLERVRLVTAIAFSCPVAYHRKRRGEECEADRNLAGQHVLEGLRPGVRNVQHRNSSARLSPQRREVSECADAGGRIRQRTRRILRGANDIGKSGTGKRWVSDDQQRLRGDHPDRGQRRQRIDRSWPMQSRHCGERIGAEQKRVAVRGRTRHRFAGDSSGSAGPVLDDDALPKGGRKMLGGGPCQRVERGAGRDRRDQPYRPRRPSGGVAVVAVRRTRGAVQSENKHRREQRGKAAGAPSIAVGEGFHRSLRVG